MYDPAAFNVCERGFWLAACACAHHHQSRTRTNAILVPGRGGRVYVGRDLHARAGTEYTSTATYCCCYLLLVPGIALTIDLLALLAQATGAAARRINMSI